MVEDDLMKDSFIFSNKYYICGIGALHKVFFETYWTSKLMFSQREIIFCDIQQQIILVEVFKGIYINVNMKDSLQTVGKLFRSTDWAVRYCKYLIGYRLGCK